MEGEISSYWLFCQEVKMASNLIWDKAFINTKLIPAEFGIL